MTATWIRGSGEHKCAWIGRIPLKTQRMGRASETEVGRCDKVGARFSTVVDDWFCARHITSKQASDDA